jgi:ribonuclease HII
LDFAIFMVRPTLKIEKSLWRQGKNRVVGLDEVGVGALAGPVVVAAVCLPKNYKPSRAIKSLLRDSKALSPAQREYLFGHLTVDKSIEWILSRVNPSVIDQINIRRSVFLAMRRCLRRFNKIDYVLVDGASVLESYPIAQKAIVAGDKTVFSIAVASVIAKVIRDEYMRRLDKVVPEYRFKIHKGYGTKEHFKKISEFGLSFNHRLSFCDHVAFATQV